MTLSRRLRRLAVALRDAEAILSLDPRQWAARAWNKVVGRGVGRLAGKLYVRRKR